MTESGQTWVDFHRHITNVHVKVVEDLHLIAYKDVRLLMTGCMPAAHQCSPRRLYNAIYWYGCTGRHNLCPAIEV
jgi:hypothetical protein